MSAPVILALVAAVAATAFTLDLTIGYLRRRRSHVGAYAAGMAMFAAATWALWWGEFFGWSDTAYRVFYLFGAILNIPMLATGSMYLVVGKRSGTALNIFTGALAAISTTLVFTVSFAAELPVSGVPKGIFAAEGFGPRLLAAIGSATGTALLVGLALVSVFRQRRKNPRVVIANLMIVTGVSTVAASGALVGLLGEDQAFEAALLVAITLIWGGYRVARTKSKRRGPIRLLLVGPTSQPASRPRTERLIEQLESAGYQVMCPARDIEEWGRISFAPADTMLKIFRQVEESQVVLVDLSEGEAGEVVAGYARGVRKPVVVSTPDGIRVPRSLRAVALDEIYYTTPSDIINRLERFLSALDD